jgi:hypothetical protein
MSGTRGVIAGLSAVAWALASAGSAADARQLPQELAGRLSGTWVLNRDLSTGFGPAGPGRGRGGAAQAKPLFAMADAGQRRGGGGGAGGGGISDATDLTPEQRAEQAAMRQLQQIDERITIKAAADTVTFVDGRGERTFAVNDKASTIDVGGSPVKVKSKWDKRVLKQEFSNTQARLVETWGLDDADHLVLTAKVESMTLGIGASADRITTLVTPDRKAVFDRR